MTRLFRIVSLGIVAICGLALSVRAQVGPPVSTGRLSLPATQSIGLRIQQTGDSLRRLTQPGYYRNLFGARQQPQLRPGGRLLADACNTYLCSAISPATSLTLSNNGPLTCTLTSVTLTATGSPNAGGTYTFSGPDGPLASKGNIALVTKAGTYTVTLSESTGQSATAQTTVGSNTTTPVATLTASSLTLCAQNSVTLTVASGTTSSVTTYAFAGPGLNQNGVANTATASQGGTFSVVVTNASGCTASASVALTVTPATSITAQPASASNVCAGSSVQTSVGAAGSALSYQWYRGGVLLAGQTAATLSLSAVEATDNGAYYVVTVGTCGNPVTSNSLSLTVNTRPTPPTLTAVSRTTSQSLVPLPLSPFVNAGGTLSFSSVNGPLNPPTADVSQVGVQSFSVSQTNATGCVSLPTPFTITVQPGSTTTTPASQTVCRSSAVVLQAITTGTRYEWYKNGQSAPFKLTEIASIQKGTATSSLTLVSIQTTASYYVKVFQANNSFSFEGPFVVTADYSCTAPSARQAAPLTQEREPIAETNLQVVLTPNPLTDGRLRAIVQGAEGQPLTVELLDLRGRKLHQQQWAGAAPAQTLDWDVSGQPAGAYLLRAVNQRASGASQSQTLKVIKPD